MVSPIHHIDVSVLGERQGGHGDIDRIRELSRKARKSDYFTLLGVLPSDGPIAIRKAGERLRHRLSETAFKRLMLAMFAIMGLNLIRRALF